MTISALAKQAGLRPSAIRYYESIGLLAPPPRRSGQRSYDARALRLLAVIGQAQDAGFTLDEARVVVQSPDSLSEEWNRVAERKLEELEAQIDRLRGRQDLIRRMQQSCKCRNADQCGSGLLEGRRRRMLSSSMEPAPSTNDCP